MHLVRKLILVIAIMFGCSSPKDATETNFKKAINEYFTQEAKPCLDLGMALPRQLTSQEGASAAPLLAELVQLGFVSVADSEKEMFDFLSTRKRKAPAKTFALTDKGKAIATVEERITGNTQLCYGRYQVTDVTNFTAPADMMGLRVTNVDFQFEAADLADWATRSTVLQKHSQQLARDIGSRTAPLTGHASLVLTNNGWVHERLQRRNHI